MKKKYVVDTNVGIVANRANTISTTDLNELNCIALPAFLSSKKYKKVAY